MKFINLIKKIIKLISRKFKKFLHSRRSIENGSTKLNVVSTFLIYGSGGWGSYKMKEKVVINSINQTPEALSRFAQSNNNNVDFEKKLKNFIKKEDDLSLKLKSLLNFYGSDKASNHDYHLLYSSIISEIGIVSKIFEIGIGTNNPRIVSTMGHNGKPGASLRAFRDFTSEAQIYGADIDKDILFKEERINTFYLDQTNLDTFTDLRSKIGTNFNLMIDDGLHSLNTNLNSLKFFLDNLAVGGYGIIEDVDHQSKPFYLVVSDLIKEKYLSSLIKFKNSSLFVVKRIS